MPGPSGGASCPHSRRARAPGPRGKDRARRAVGPRRPRRGGRNRLRGVGRPGRRRDQRGGCQRRRAERRGRTEGGERRRAPRLEPVVFTAAEYRFTIRPAALEWKGTGRPPPRKAVERGNTPFPLRGLERVRLRSSAPRSSRPPMSSRRRSSSGSSASPRRSTAPRSRPRSSSTASSPRSSPARRAASSTGRRRPRSSSPSSWDSTARRRRFRSWSTRPRSRARRSSPSPGSFAPSSPRPFSSRTRAPSSRSSPPRWFGSSSSRRTGRGASDPTGGRGTPLRESRPRARPAAAQRRLRRPEERAGARRPSRPGRELNVAATSSALLRAASRPTNRTAAVVVAEFEPRMTTADARALRVERQLGSYSTLYAGTADRINNLQLGVELLDGARIAPGDTWSFNEFVGPRTAERGFRSAPVIMDGKYEEESAAASRRSRRPSSTPPGKRASRSASATRTPLYQPLSGRPRCHRELPGRRPEARQRHAALDRDQGVVRRAAFSSACSGPGRSAASRASPASSR